MSNTDSVIADLQGKLKAMERELAIAKREAETAKKEAQAAQAGADETISNAAEQLAIANALTQGMFALGQWAAAHIENCVSSLHVLHREGTLVGLLDKAAKAIQANDKTALSQLVTEVEPIVKTHKANEELLKVEIEKACQLQFQHKASQVMDTMLALLEDPSLLPTAGVYAAR